MKTYVKCNYCGKKYAVHDAHDCCPNCGAFNEFELKTSSKKVTINNNETSIFKKILRGFWNWFKRLKFKFKLVILFIFIFIIPAIISGIIDSINYEIWKSQQKDYTFYYSSSLLEDPNAFLGAKNSYIYERDWNTEVTVYGTFDELYEYVYKNLMKDQFQRMSYSLNASGKIKYKDTTIFVDGVSLDLDNYSNSLVLDYEIEGDDVPNSLELYLCSGEDIKDRILITSYEKEEHGNLLNYFFNEESQRYNHFELNSSGVVKYDSLQIEIDEEIHKIDLKYDEDLDISIEYYGYKLNED